MSSVCTWFEISWPPEGPNRKSYADLTARIDSEIAQIDRLVTAPRHRQQPSAQLRQPGPARAVGTLLKDNPDKPA